VLTPPSASGRTWSTVSGSPRRAGAPRRIRYGIRSPQVAPARACHRRNPDFARTFVRAHDGRSVRPYAGRRRRRTHGPNRGAGTMSLRSTRAKKPTNAKVEARSGFEPLKATGLSLGDGVRRISPCAARRPILSSAAWLKNSVKCSNPPESQPRSMRLDGCLSWRKPLWPSARKRAS
jgi:hypothetical protein